MSRLPKQLASRLGSTGPSRFANDIGNREALRDPPPKRRVGTPDSNVEVVEALSQSFSICITLPSSANVHPKRSNSRPMRLKVISALQGSARLQIVCAAFPWGDRMTLLNCD